MSSKSLILAWRFSLFVSWLFRQFSFKKPIKIHDTIIKIPPKFEAPIKRRWFEIKWKKLGKKHSWLGNYLHDLSSAIIVRPIELKLFNQYIENVSFRWVSVVVRFYFCTVLLIFIAAFKIGKAFFIVRLTLKNSWIYLFGKKCSISLERYKKILMEFIVW